MDFEASGGDHLESMLLDTTAKPIPLPLSLLKSITNNFSNDQEIGRGGFSVVYKGRLCNGLVAVKKLSLELDMDEKTFKNELLCLIRVKHKNIIRFLGYCVDTQGIVELYQTDKVIADIRQRLLCFEFLPNGGLDKHMDDKSCEIEWRTCYQIIKGICVGLQYLHQQNIVHGDLKPSNILLDDDMVPKIADFGQSRCFDEKQTRAVTENLVGTLGYMPPEFFTRKLITLKSDIYSLGIIIIEVLTGQKGYLHLPVENILEIWTIRFRTSLESTWTEYARVCAEIGLKCMDFEYTKRPDMQHIIESLDKLERRTLMEIDTTRSSDRPLQTSKEIGEQEFIIITPEPSHPSQEQTSEEICEQKPAAPIQSHQVEMEIDTTRSSDRPLQTRKEIGEQEYMITTPEPSHPPQEQTSEEICEQKPAAPIQEPSHQVEMEIDTTRSSDRTLQTSKEIDEQEFVITTPEPSHPPQEQTSEDICEQKPAVPLPEQSHQVEMEMDTARSSDRPGQTHKEIGKQEPFISQVPSHTAEEMAHSMTKSILGSIVSKAASATKVFHHKASKKRQDYFEQHGGRMLSRILEADGNSTFKLYDKGDLEKATRGFHKANVVWEGAHGTVYMATLGTATVAVKRCKQIDKTRTDEFVQELVVLCRVNHPNIVRLLGCCLHFKAPMLVYEFVPKGTLGNLLYGRPRRRVMLPTRLRIAAETAEALAHLHSPPHPTLHGDVKPQNILLGDGWVAKVSDFGCSTINDNVQVVPKGTLAYLDPEFLQDFQITEKTDVYSFGVVLIELLTSKNPQDIEWKNLTLMFQDSMGNGTLGDLLDADIVEEGSMALIYAAAKLVSRCIAVPGTARPAMGQVAVELRRYSDEMPESPEARVALEFEDSSYSSAATEGKTKESKGTQGYFEQHGGRLLSRILETDGNITFKLYDKGDIEKATRGFHKANVVGEGTHGTVYKAILGTATVAVKRCKQIEKSRTDEFVQELVVLCRVNHPNIVRLLGCCLHFEAPMLVYEFVPNGTLGDLLYGRPRHRVTLPTRLRIAAETAEALAHLHSPPHPTLHGDVKPQNIVLGDGWVAKVSDFGCSTINDNVVPKSTLAYLDPEFFKDFQKTDKTDVYSFGVVLIELLTGKNPQAKGKNLTLMFQDSMGNGTLGDLLDADIVEEGSMALIYAAAKLVSRCIAVPGTARPAMGQVAVELRRFSDQMPESLEARVALGGWKL